MSHEQNTLPVSAVPSASPAPQIPLTESYYEVERGHTLREYLDILLRRKWWILGTMGVLFSVAALYCYLKTPIYRATAVFEITNDNPGANVGTLGSTMGLGSWFYAQKFQETQYKILQSRSLALRVIKHLNLDEHPDFAFIKESKEPLSQDEIEELLFLNFKANLSVEPVRNTYLVEVSYESPDRLIAKKVLDVLANEYMYLLIDRRNESYALVRNWLNNQLNQMAEKVHEAQRKLYNFGQKTDIYTIEDKDNVIVKKFIDLSSLLTKAQSETLAKKAQYEQLKTQGPHAPLIVNHPLISSLRQETVIQQAKVSGLERIYLSGHPELQAESAKLAELRNRLNAEVRRLQESAKADYEAAERTEQLLRESLEAQKQQMATLQENLSNYQILKQDAQTNEQLYQALLARVKEANISSTMVPSNIAVIDPAPVPTMPYKPKTVMNLALALTLGLILGVGLALVVEAIDDSVKSVEDLEKRCQMPILGLLPSVTNAAKAKALAPRRRELRSLPLVARVLPPKRVAPAASNLDLIVYESPQNPFSEALRHLQTSIMLSVSGSPPAAIMVTSPNPSEGKTMVASNLAISLALNGRPTVLVDCDMRKPRLHKVYRSPLHPGLSNYLTGNAGLEEILHATEIPHLTVIPAGPQSPTPMNLLNSDYFREFLRQLRERFAHIIIDTPPILGFSDARIISVLMDGSLLVTKYHVTPKQAVRLAVQMLGQVNAPLMGGVLNCVDGSGMKYGSYRYYEYYSHYYRHQEKLPDHPGS